MPGVAVRVFGCCWRWPMRGRREPRNQKRSRACRTSHEQINKSRLFLAHTYRHRGPRASHCARELSHSATRDRRYTIEDCGQAAPPTAQPRLETSIYERGFSCERWGRSADVWVGEGEEAGRAVTQEDRGRGGNRRAVTRRWARIEDQLTHLLLAVQGEQRDAGHLHDLETHTRNIADGVALTAEASDQNLVLRERHGARG